jgi:hypothetical protein
LTLQLVAVLFLFIALDCSQPSFASLLAKARVQRRSLDEQAGAVPLI